MSQNIKNNLFRFVTLRNPQLIEEKDKQLGFIYHPDKGSGLFYPPFNAALEGEKKQVLIDSKDSIAGSPLLFKTKKDVKGINPNLYNFSSWLMRNKNALSYAEILDNITLNDSTTISGLEGDEINVWDNLIYQTMARDSVYVREALIQMLIADNFLGHFDDFSKDLTEVITFTEDQEKEFKRCANASVVISKELLLETYSESSTNTKPRSANAEHQKRLGDLLTAKYDKLALKNLAEELKALQKAYKNQETANYKTALDNHQKDVDTIIDTTGTVRLVDQWNVETQAYIQVEKFTHDALPKFTYTKAVEIDAHTLQGALSVVSSKYLTDNKLETLPTYDTILKEVKQLSKACDSKVEQLLPKTSKSILKGGINMRVEDPFVGFLNNFGDTDAFVKELVDSGVNNDDIRDMAPLGINPEDIGNEACYTVKLVATARPNAGTSNRDWTFKLGFMNHGEPVSIVSLDHSVTFSNDSTVYNSSDYFSSFLGSSYKIGLFRDISPIEKGPTAGLPMLSGTIILSNGETLSFSEIIRIGPVEGIKDLVGNVALNFACEEETIVEIPPSENLKRYGVTNLGIADFRRVEQEVCCYVPGEVSHIENVMAREYKERSTRSLTSSEFTTEQTDERERENLTDSTTTERNEMQSEVASVLNEDQSQSYGGNVSVGGEKFGLNFSAGAYFDNASSSSTSDSNSQAQTYAQEVTERAMERIVQKIQTKRTSRILKEFEENNSHGFDNRKGENHVTGVYRWVDKIYKNTLINYGKRLMYEFAIPEPSKFFQEVVWKEVDTTGQVESGVILPELPVHPITLGLTDPSILGLEDNGSEKDYQKIAAKYNAEVNAPLVDDRVVNKSYSIKPAAQEWAAYSFPSNPGEDVTFEAISIPDNYYCKSAEVHLMVDHEGGSNHARAYAVIGDEKVHFTTNDKLNPNVFVDLDAYRFEEELSFSVYGYDLDATSINIIAFCALKDEAFEQWQNETYNAIMEAYYDRVQEYNDAIREKEANEGLTPEAEKLTFNPLQNQSIMLRELKRVAIELLIDQNKVSKNNYEVNEITEIPKVIKTEAFQTHASTVKFFEQAFDWDIMAYVFYPYFYANQGDWERLFQSQDVADPLFQAFLQSGMARTVVPVRPGFEDAVNWYMTTGETWNGQGLVVDQDDDLYVSIAEEMQTVDGIVEGTWETRLPTALTILQADSIGLDVQGLPCNTECDPEGTNPIKPSTNLIGGPDGVGSDYVSDPITVQ